MYCKINILRTPRSAVGIIKQSVAGAVWRYAVQSYYSSKIKKNDTNQHQEFGNCSASFLF